MHESMYGRIIIRIKVKKKGIKVPTNTKLNIVINSGKAGLPWWSSGLRTTLQCRGHQFSPWSRKTPHAAGQPSPCATTSEARALEPEICRKRRCCSEKPVHHCRVAPLAATREKPSRKNEDLAQPQINKQVKKHWQGSNNM